MLDDDIDRDGISDLIPASVHGGWFLGMCHSHKNVLLRINQSQWAGDPERSLSLGRKIVVGKIWNCRMLLRRDNAEVSQASLDSMAVLAKKGGGASRMESLRMKPVQGSLPQQFKAAEILELQAQRDEARVRR